MNAFDQIYSNNIWAFGSGHGSLPSVTKGYRRFLEDFLRRHNIKSVLDYGCGDWQFSRFINWGSATYVGADVAAAVVERNNRKFASKQISFRGIGTMTGELPKAELIIVKDVLQHLRNAEVTAFLDSVVRNYKYGLITNCVLPASRINSEIPDGEFRPLDLRRHPFNIRAEEVYSFPIPRVFSWRKLKFLSASKKIVLLVRGEN